MFADQQSYRSIVQKIDWQENKCPEIECPDINNPGTILNGHIFQTSTNLFFLLGELSQIGYNSFVFFKFSRAVV